MSRANKQDEHLPSGAIVYWSRKFIEGWDYYVPVWCPDCEEERNVNVNNAGKDSFTGICAKCLDVRRSAAARRQYPSADERLDNGNIMHWSELFAAADGNLHVPVTCTDCGRKRLVQAKTTRRANFTGWCIKHWQWHASPAPGMRRKDTDGYVEVKLARDHPFNGMTHRNGWIREHRLVMAQHMGRPLASTETVHHRNGRRDDNRLENLELWHRGHPIGQRVEDLEPRHSLAWFVKYLLDNAD